MVFLKEGIQLVFQTPKEEKKPCYDNVDLWRLSFEVVGHSILSAKNWSHVLVDSLCPEYLLEPGLSPKQESRWWLIVISY